MSLDTLSRRLRTLADPMRLRILHLLRHEELTVSELMEVLNSGQPRVSAHLARLSEEGLLGVRREGRFSVYFAVDRPDTAALLAPILQQYAASTSAAVDLAALKSVVARRSAEPAPGTLGKDELPGRTWEGFARAVLALLPPLRIADLGIGLGEIALLFAEGAERVIAVDHDPRVLARAEEKARAAGLSDRIDFRRGDLTDPPIERGEVELWVLSQVLHLVAEPAKALAAAADRLEPGGRVLVLDLLAHGESWVEERLGHRHLGFTEVQLRDLIERAGFSGVRVRRAARDRRPPHFVSLLGLGRQP